MKDFRATLADYILSGHAMLAVLTSEKSRAIEEIIDAADEISRPIHVWNIATGWQNADGQPSIPQQGFPEPDLAVQEIMKLPQGSIGVLKDFGPYVRYETCPKSDLVCGWLEQIKSHLYEQQKAILFVGPEFANPTALKHDITHIDFSLPDEEQIEKQIRYVCEGVESEQGQFKPDEEMVPEIVDACKGMTQQQIIDRVALALRVHKNLTPAAKKLIIHEKAGLIRQSGILTYYEPPEGGLDMIGGLDALKQHVQLDKPCFSDEAQQFGIDYPKGVLLVGLPGCGKTLTTLGIASDFNLPLIRFDVGSVMSKYVGESEAQIREAIRLMEAIAPCIVQFDEIEKGFGGVGDLDGGASQRVFGTVIKWMNDRTCPVYIVATANRVQSLPPEFMRKGRFDEIFFVDLPSEPERAEIIRIHLAKRNRKPEQFDIPAVVKATEGFTGSDIEQAVKMGLKMAFSDKKELTTDYCIQGAASIVPLTKTEVNRIEEIRTWCSTRAKPANENLKTKGKPNRKISVSRN